jgi:hypothetical protein
MAVGSPANGMTGHTVIFNAMTTRSVDWVDLHYNINSQTRPWQMNVRMRPAIASAEAKTFEHGNIMLSPGDRLSYSFTSCSQGVDCDTEEFTFIMPQPVTHAKKTHTQTTGASTTLFSTPAATGMPAATLAKPCMNPIQFTHRATEYRVGAAKMRLSFVPQRGANLQLVTVRWLICSSPTCPENMSNVAESAFQVTRQMIPRGEEEGFQLLNVPNIQGKKLVYMFTYETATSMCTTGAFSADMN